MRKSTLTAVALVVCIGTAALAADSGKPEYGSWGQDMTSIDATVKPGDDF